MPTPGIYAWHHGKGGVPFFRMQEPLRVAALHEVNTGMGRQLDDEIAEQYDTILAHMLWQEHPSEAWAKLAENGRHRLVLDIDDLMWRPDWPPFKKAYTRDVLARVERNIAMAHVVTTPTEYLADFLSKFNPNVYVCPNYLPQYVGHLTAPPRPYPAGENGITKIVGYQGSPSHAKDFSRELYMSLGSFVGKNPEWGFHVWGPDAVEAIGDRWGNTPWQDSLDSYYRSLSMDIGIGPLKPTPFNAAKSGLRAIEYATLGIPAVVSAGPTYAPWVVDGVTGFLVPRGGSWSDTLTMLARDNDLRATMAVEARTLALGWTTEANIWRWVDAWNSM